MEAVCGLLDQMGTASIRLYCIGAWALPRESANLSQVHLAATAAPQWVSAFDALMLHFLCLTV